MVGYNEFLVGYGFKVDPLDSSADPTASVEVINTYLGYGVVGLPSGSYPNLISLSMRRQANTAVPYQLTVQAFCCRSSELE